MLDSLRFKGRSHVTYSILAVSCDYDSRRLEPRLRYTGWKDLHELSDLARSKDNLHSSWGCADNVDGHRRRFPFNIFAYIMYLRTYYDDTKDCTNIIDGYLGSRMELEVQ